MSFSCEATTAEGFEKIKKDFSRALASSYEKGMLRKEFIIQNLASQ